MNSFFNSDLASERCQNIAPFPREGVENEEKDEDGVLVRTIRILTEEAARAVGKPTGTYVTVEYDRTFRKAFHYRTAVKCLAEVIDRILPKKRESVFCVGLGNPHLTADAFGPKVIDGLIVTHHIRRHDETLFRSLRLSDVSALSPGVLGQTGLESADIISATVRKIRPDVLILTDALAALDKERLCSTVQICDTGITPGSGIGNKRIALNRETLGVPVISLGVPTVIRAAALCESEQKETDGSDLIVTPKDIDLLLNRAARLTSEALNKVFHPFLTEEEVSLWKE